MKWLEVAEDPRTGDDDDLLSPCTPAATTGRKMVVARTG